MEPGGYLREILTARVYDVAVRSRSRLSLRFSSLCSSCLRSGPSCLNRLVWAPRRQGLSLH